MSLLARFSQRLIAIPRGLRSVKTMAPDHIDKQIELYKQVRTSLLQSHNGKTIAFLDGKIIGEEESEESETHLVNLGYQKTGVIPLVEVVGNEFYDNPRPCSIPLPKTDTQRARAPKGMTNPASTVQGVAIRKALPDELDVASRALQLTPLARLPSSTNPSILPSGSLGVQLGLLQKDLSGGVPVFFGLDFTNPDNFLTGWTANSLGMPLMPIPSHIRVLAQIPNVAKERRLLQTVYYPVAFSGKVRYLRFVLADDDIPIEGDTLGAPFIKHVAWEKQMAYGSN